MSEGICDAILHRELREEPSTASGGIQDATMRQPPTLR